MAALPKKIDKYEVLAELGRGAMGTVYKARDPVLERLVALKTMSEELHIEDEMRRRFEREARSAARLQHPNIVTIFELGGFGEGETLFIAMELLEGLSLAQLLEDQQLPRLEDKIQIILQICRGLDFAHKRGVIHRDVKPGNIQVLPGGTAKILDFGIAWGDGSTVKTKTGLVMGTPNYMAPEQIAGAPVDHRADMWAVGIILYELLRGERPFSADTVPSLVYRIVHAPPPVLDARELGISNKLVSIVQRVLMKDPDARFRDLAQMAGALEQVMGAPVSERGPSETDRQRSYGTNLDLARNLLLRGEPARALEAARRAQALEPTHRSVVDLIGEIELALAKMGSERTVIGPPRTMGVHGVQPVAVDATKWIDEARLALTAGNRTEALRLVDDVLAVNPSFPAAIELKEILDKPAAPGRARSGSLRIPTHRRLRAAPTYRELVTFGEPPGIQVIRVSPATELAAVGGLDGSIRLWNLASRSRLTTFRSGMHQRAGHEGLVTSLGFSADGRLLASGHVDGVIHLWDMDAGEEIPVRFGHDASVGQLVFAPDGATLASGGLDSTLKLWDLDLLQQREARRRLIRQPSGVTTLAYSLDGSLLITGHTNRVVRIHDAATGRLTATLRGHGAALTCMALSPDGNQIATGAQDRTIRLFDLNRRVESKVLEGHKKAVTSIAYFADGLEAASVAMDNSLIIWDLEAGTPRATLWGATGESFSSIAVVDEGSLIVGGLADGRLRIWGPGEGGSR